MIMEEGTPTDPEYQTNDGDKALRPKKLVDFTGQSIVKENLAIFIESARKRNETMIHEHLLQMVTLLSPYGVKRVGNGC